MLKYLILPTTTTLKLRQANPYLEHTLIALRFAGNTVTIGDTTTSKRGKVTKPTTLPFRSQTELAVILHNLLLKHGVTHTSSEVGSETKKIDYENLAQSLISQVK